MNSDDAFADFNAALKTAKTPYLDGPTPPTIFICGTPRSGTTFLYQLMSYAGNLGYISNLVARFAANPALGIRLSQALDLPKTFTGESQFGQTRQLAEPHEFGRGWSDILNGVGVQQPDVTNPLSPESLVRIEQIARAFGQTTLFKSFAYFWYIEALAQAMPNSYWIWITRDNGQSARSLEKLYHQKSSDYDAPTWASAVLAETRKDVLTSDVPAKCDRQIRDLHMYLERQFARLPENRKYIVELKTLLDDQTSCLGDIFLSFDVTPTAGALEEFR